MKLNRKKLCKASGFLKGMASPHRLAILCVLIEHKNCSVSTLIDATGIAQTSMSQHLAKLRAEGIIDFERDHRTLYYRITNKHTHDVMKVLYRAFCAPTT
jgi:DNA-binding transcriptional ArsR family regulator